METTYYLVTPRNTLKSFVHERDAEYFSKPVRVEWLRSGISKAHNVFVRDPVRGHEYPCERKHLVPYYLLTRKQQAACINS
jgi:hypothetical protein